MMQAFIGGIYNPVCSLEHNMYQRECVGRRIMSPCALMWPYLPVMRQRACSHFIFSLQPLTLWVFSWLLNADLPPRELERTTVLIPFTWLLSVCCWSCIGTPTPLNTGQPCLSLLILPSIFLLLHRQTHSQFISLVTCNGVVDHWLVHGRNYHCIPTA